MSNIKKSRKMKKRTEVKTGKLKDKGVAYI